MPVLKVYHHGSTAGVAPSRNDHSRAKRGDVGGWSFSSTRSNTRFLYSIRESELTGIGKALTLTLKDCPDSHDDWHRMRDSFFKRLKRIGMIRAHWLTEWQRRGVPHMHCAVWFKTDVGSEPLVHWWSLAKAYGARIPGQHCKPIVDSIGWFQYLSKHASRGVSHYQRSPENIPPGWKKTGRMWGYLGDWPREEAMRFSVPTEAFHRFRRMVRGLVRADARAARDARRISHTRSMLTCHDRDLSHVRGVSEWIPMDVQLMMIMHLAATGFDIEQE